MEKELFAVVAIYKSEAVDYLKDNNIAREDALIINTVEDFEEAKTKFIKDVKFISAPMGIASNEDDLRKLLVSIPSEMDISKLEKATVDPSIIEGDISEEDAKEAARILNEKILTPIIDGDSSKDEEEIKEIKTISDEEIGSGLKELAKREIVEPEVETPEVKSVDNDETRLKAMIDGGKKSATKKPVTRKKGTPKK